jgi:16S rRNA (uracil1498-N3)-methyltransferase
MDVDHLTYILLDEKVSKSLLLKGDIFKYLIKVRRHTIDDTIAIRFKNEIQNLYTYTIVSIENRVLSLDFNEMKIYEVKSEKKLHIGWCIIDPKSIEKVLPSLNEIGVNKISFISCQRSQKNFKLDFKRFERILEASMQQCGRSNYITFDTYKNIQDFISAYPDTKVFDFCDNPLQGKCNFQTILIGCEGGFSDKEKDFLKKQDIFRLDTKMILRSESAAIAVASKILL